MMPGTTERVSATHPAPQVFEHFRARFGDVLRSPTDGEALHASPDGSALLTPSDRKAAAVREGVIDFVSPQADDRGDEKGFAFQWNNILAGNLSDKIVYNNTRASLLQSVLHPLGLTPEWFKGRTFVDLGSGHGQYVRAFAGVGAKALGVDLSEVVYRCTHEDRAINPDLDTTYIRGDLLDLPLLPRSFDCVISIGVSNTTPDARKACIEAAKRVKAGGYFMFYNYEKGAVGYVNVRERLPFLTKLPRPLLLWVCRAMAVPLAFYLTGRHGKLPTLQTFRTGALGLFDAIEPRYCWTCTPETILSWLNDPAAGLSDVRRVAPCFYTARGKL
ncbi:MAG: class I SAM-dependent methyltransferase [Phycisphaerales bacterium]